ncbi:Cytoplasmic dynein 1 intermediate chain 2 [Fragariocoptes setiger]|uniref:Cytoplasmic dynein 1 intermediate chain 2 n=1 Tax=Fragariocoptes setiger TaxID=1670756 RepID=A0ABQ7S8C7_9ACAR|nr:Cytoplasmic dynein 1 intermediate chain 2 [Fragariocoptes setiger]
MGDNRRAELERKRNDLARLREVGRQRQMLREQQERERPVGAMEEADLLLQRLGLPPIRTASAGGDSGEATSDSHFNLQSGESNNLQPHYNQHALHSDNMQQLQSPNRKPMTTLQVVHVNQISIPPKENVVYEKSTQTANTQDPPVVSQGPRNDYYVLTYGDDEEDDESRFEEDYEVGGSDFIPRSRKNRSTSTSQQSGLPQPVWAQPPTQDSKSDKDADIKENKILRELTEEERKKIEMSDDYKQFIDRATKILERALYTNESPDIFVDYFPEGAKRETNSDDKSGNKLTLNRVFYDEKWSKNRCITSFDWSLQYPELLLASYFSNEEAPSDPDGTVLVWNMKFKKASPEYVFHCQSPIMSCCFAKFHPSLIVGGTYSGQIALWDLRSNKKTPVQRSPLSVAAHTHPVYCTQVVGTQNAHNLISISTDGKLCSWSLDMLSAPQETMELSQQKQTRAVAVTCMSFHADDYNNFIVGSEEGVVYSACRHGSKTGILSGFESHQGPVTSIDYHPNAARTSFSHLFLTSSIDWTVKLWSNKLHRPIYSFENNCDYLYDVRWSPIHPALFATADGVGRVDIWNLNNDTELPTASTVVDGQPALNKILWTPNGHQVVVGDDTGRVHVYDVGEQLAIPKSSDEGKLVYTLNELKQNALESETQASVPQL